MQCPHCQTDNPKEITTTTYGDSYECVECGIIWPATGNLIKTDQCKESHTDKKRCEITTLSDIKLKHCCICGVVTAIDVYDINKAQKSQPHLIGHLNNNRAEEIAEGLGINSKIDVVILDALYHDSKETKLPIKIVAKLTATNKKINEEINEMSQKINGEFFIIEPLAILDSTTIDTKEGVVPFIGSKTSLVDTKFNKTVLESYIKELMEYKNHSKNSDYI